MTDFTDTPEPPPPPKPPPVPFRVGARRLAVRAAVVLAFVAVVLLVGRHQAGRVGQRQLDRIVAKLDAEEPGWRLEDIEAERAKRVPPPERNAALLVLAAADRLPDNWYNWHQDALWLYSLPENHRPPEDHVRQLCEQAPRTAEARALALGLRDRPTGHFPLTFPDDRPALFSPQSGKAMSVTDLLEFDAFLAILVDRDPNRGIRAAHAALNAARSVGDEPTLGSQWVRVRCRNQAARIAVQTLAWSTPTEGLAELQAALLAEAEEPVFLNAVRGNRANLHHMFLGLEAGRFEMHDVYESIHARPPDLARPAAFRAYRPLLYRDHAEFLRRFTAGVAVAKLPPHEQRAAARELCPSDREEHLSPVPIWFAPDIRHCATSVLLSRAELVTTAVGLACERFRLKHGRWPHELAELAPDFIPAVPVSPFDAQPMWYLVFPDRIVIGCRIVEDNLRWVEPPEFEDPDDQGSTIGVRLRIPAARALPPKPPETNP